MEAGNVKAIREALEKAMSFFDRGVICTSYANSASEMDELERWYDDIKTTLAEPPRNCDVGTAEEQSRRLSEFCESHGLVDGLPRCEKCRFSGDDRCELMWAQMPYEESEATHGNA